MPAAPPAEGLVVQVDAKVCHVRIGDEVVHAAPRGALFEDLGDAKNPVAVGDRVLVDFAGDPVSLVEVLPRRNWLGRVASSHDPREQVLVANVDQLFMISSMKSPRFSSNRADRVLAACRWHDVPTVLVLNKVDLVQPDEVAAIRATYENVPIEVVTSSAKTGEGVVELRERLKDRTTVLYGGSGVGKSSLLNAIQPGLNLKEGRISRHWEQGRHTTSFSRLLELELGGRAVDTPGIRVFRPYGLHRSDVRGLFPDLARLQPRCRFTSCTHDHEPGCAVLEALEAGELPESRYNSYLEMLLEVSPDPLPDDEPIDDSEMMEEPSD